MILSLDALMTVKELKAFFTEEIKKKLGFSLDKEYVLLREYMVDRPTKVIFI